MTQPVSRLNASALIASKQQVEEYKKVSNCKVPSPAGTKAYKRMSQGRSILYHVRKVKGDGDCFFHAVNQPNLNRDELIRRLRENATNESVRRSFASEIRQFIYLENHENPAEQQARYTLFTDEIRNLFAGLIASENVLQNAIIQARQQLGQQQTLGKQPPELLQLLQQGGLPLAVVFSNSLQAVSQANDAINLYCSRESVFTSYVEHYLSGARGFIPFTRKMEGENVRTPIDVINELFHLNIQIYLPDGIRVTAPIPGEEIAIYHNGTNHFSGLNRVPDLPTQVGETIAAMPVAEKPENYIMYHLLQNSHIGIQYQLLVLMNKALKLMAQGQKNFEATLEAKEQGNLDDITFIYKDQHNVQKVEAFQVKHYVEGIHATDFVKIGKSKKTEKLHIGKFLDGWLSLKANYPNLRNEDLLSVVYCNQGLDPVMASSIEWEIFQPDFVEKKKSVLLNGKSKTNKDFFDLMFEQSKLHLTKDNLHPRYTSLPEAQQKALFKDFLRSFRFKMKRKDVQQLEESILIQLSKVLKDKTIKYDLLFMNLYYALGEWFRHDEKTRIAPKLTFQVLDNFLKDSLAKGELSVYLQGVSHLTLSHLSNQCGDETLPRKELKTLEEAVQKSGWTAVVGEKGIGKSGLIKALLRQYQPYEYFVLSTKDLIGNGDLKSKVGMVLKKASIFRLVVLDGAELLLGKQSTEQQEILKLFSFNGLRVIFTITPEAVSILPQATTVLQVEPLNIKQVLERFPKLQPYEDVKSLMKLATIPFHLNNIVGLLAAWKTTDFALLTADKARLEEKLTEAVVCGQDIKLRNAWTKLALAMSKGEILRVDKLELPQGVFSIQTMQFSHDLFFEYGLINYWQNQWAIQSNTLEFWESLPHSLQFDNPLFVLAKWYLLYKEALSTDLINICQSLVNTPVFNTILALAIVSKENNLLKKLLEHNPKAVSSNIGDPSILLAIRYDLPEALKALLKLGESAHHPETGPLVLSSYSAHYAPKKYVSTSSEESSSEEESVDEGYVNHLSGSDRSSEDSYDESSESDDEDMIQYARNLMLSPEKYWSSGFDQSPGYADMDGTWVPNPKFERRPNNELSYLHQAALNNSAQSLDVLLKHYKVATMIELTNSCSETPLHLGVLSGHLKVVEALISAGASVNSQDIWGETPLHNAVYSGSIEVVRFLLNHGADAESLNELGLAPLHLAFARLDLEMTKLLMSKGDYETLKLFHSMVVADLLDEVPDTKQVIMEEFVLALVEELGFEGDFVEDLMTLVEHRAKINAHDSSLGFFYTDEDTELDYAVDYGDGEHLDGLIEYILSDPDHIEQVLTSDAFSHLQEELVQGWFELANNDQYAHLKSCLEEMEDEKLLKIIRLEE